MRLVGFRRGDLGSSVSNSLELTRGEVRGKGFFWVL